MNKFANKVLLILNVLGVAALLLAYLAPLVDPAKLGIPALFGLAYPYILLVNLILIRLITSGRPQYKPFVMVTRTTPLSRDSVSLTRYCCNFMDC